MKKFLSCLLAVLMVLFLVACSGQTEPTRPAESTPPATSDSGDDSEVVSSNPDASESSAFDLDVYDPVDETEDSSQEPVVAYPDTAPGWVGPRSPYDAVDGNVDFKDATTEMAMQFVDEDMRVDYDSLGESGQVGNYDFTYQFAYPTVKTGEYITDVEATYISDISYTLSFNGATEDYVGVITFHLGHDEYLFWAEDYVPVEYIQTPELYTTINGVDVWCQDCSQTSGYSVYQYTLGAFSVTIQRNNNDELFNTAELESIMSCIQL